MGFPFCFPFCVRAAARNDNANEATMLAPLFAYPHTRQGRRIHHRRCWTTGPTLTSSPFPGPRRYEEFSEQERGARCARVGSRRADPVCRPARGGRGGGAGALPEVRRSLGHVLSMAPEVRGADQERAHAAEGPRAKERAAQEARRWPVKTRLRPGRRREHVQRVMKRHWLSEQQACRALGWPRSSHRYCGGAGLDVTATAGSTCFSDARAGW